MVIICLLYLFKRSSIHELPYSGSRLWWVSQKELLGIARVEFLQAVTLLPNHFCKYFKVFTLLILHWTAHFDKKIVVASCCFTVKSQYWWVFSSTKSERLIANQLDTVGWVIWPVKIVSDMTYNVFCGTLNPTLLLLLLNYVIMKFFWLRPSMGSKAWTWAWLLLILRTARGWH